MSYFPELLDKLTLKKHIVLKKILEGKDDYEIAEELNKSHHTVASHRKECYRVLNCHSREELIKQYKYLLQNFNKDGGG